MYLSWPCKRHADNEDDDADGSPGAGHLPCRLCVTHSETGLPLHSIRVRQELAPGPGVWHGVAKLHGGFGLFSSSLDTAAANPALGSLVKCRRQRKLMAARPPAAEAATTAVAAMSLAEGDDDDDFFGEGKKQKKEKREKKGKIPLVKDKVGQKGTRGGKSRTG